MKIVNDRDVVHLLVILPSEAMDLVELLRELLSSQSAFSNLDLNRLSKIPPIFECKVLRLLKCIDCRLLRSWWVERIYILNCD